MMRKMWFGTKRFARWIKVHSPGSEHVAQGFSARLDYLNGGVGVRRSTSGHEERQLTWNRLTDREAREISDFAFGTYGDGPFYLSDPADQRTNLLNKNWSMPGLGGKDGVPLAGTKRPALVPNLDQSQGYPVDMAQYQIDGATPRRSFYVPIPPGHTAWVGVHGDPESTSGVSVQPTASGIAISEPTSVPVSGVDTTQRVTHSFPASGEQAGIEITLEAKTSVTNLFTNSNLVGSGSIEVRRNLWTDPIQASVTTPPAGQSRWFRNSGSTPPVALEAGGWARFTSDSTYADRTIGRGMDWAANGLVVSPNTQYTVSMEAEKMAGLPDFQVTRWEYQAGGTATANDVVQTPTFDAATGRWSWTFTTAASTARLVVVVRRATGAWAVGDWYRFRRTKIELGPVMTPYGDPVIGSGDPDLTAAWAGVANESATVFSGAPISGISQTTRVFAIRSNKFGGSMRLIPTAMDGNGDSYAQVTIPAAAYAQGTFLATMHLEAPLTGALDGRGRRLVVYTPGPQQSAQSPNAAGTYEHRLVYSGLTGTYAARFYHGGTRGSGDVYWTAPGLFAGTYDGPAFTGDTPGASWDGAPDASTSTMSTYTATIAGMIVQVLPTGVTPEEGGFITGQGMTGAEISGVVRPTPYSYAHDSYGLSMRLIETEEWQ